MSVPASELFHKTRQVVQAIDALPASQREESLGLHSKQAAAHKEARQEADARHERELKEERQLVKSKDEKIEALLREGYKLKAAIAAQRSARAQANARLNKLRLAVLAALTALLAMVVAAIIGGFWPAFT